MIRLVLALLLLLALTPSEKVYAQQPSHPAGARVAPHPRHRSAAAKHQFEVATGHPHGWKGHVVDHRIPLACGGADAPANMQWQTVAAGKAKDKWERKGCIHLPVRPVTGTSAMGH